MDGRYERMAHLAKTGLSRLLINGWLDIGLLLRIYLLKPRQSWMTIEDTEHLASG
jgi:hypothetical protein